MNFRPEILANFEYQICQQTIHRITKFNMHFQLKSKLKGKACYFLARNSFKNLKTIIKEQNLGSNPCHSINASTPIFLALSI